MTQLCPRQVALLDELIQYIEYAVYRPFRFHGIIRFEFWNEHHEVACTQIIDMTSLDHTQIQMIQTGSEQEDARVHNMNRTDIIDVHLTLPDFLYMYSGDATAADICGLVYSGRVKVAWSDYRQLKQFADSIDFRPEKWTEFYRVVELDPVDPKGEDSTGCCEACRKNPKSRMDVQWELVCHRVIDSTRQADPEWEIIESEHEEALACVSIDAGADDDDELNPKKNNSGLNLSSFQDTMKKKLVNLKEYATRFLLEEEHLLDH